MSRILRHLRRGTAVAAPLAAGCGLLSLALGRRRLPLLLALALLALLLVAWALHLRDDGWFHTLRRERPPEPPPAEPARPGALPPDLAGRAFPVFQDGLVPRSDAGRPGVAWTAAEARWALVWAALELAVLSVVLQPWAGRG